MSNKPLRFIAYDINTPPKESVLPNNAMPTRIYLGLSDPREDIEARCQLLERAINTAADALTDSSPPGDAPLNVFMVPEFFFRGATGAYKMKEADYAISRLQEIAARWEGWVFVFGSILAVASRDGSTAEAYNFVLVQEGGAAASGDAGARVVMKELMSTIDFISENANPGGILIGGVEYMDAASSGPGRERQQLNYDGTGIFQLSDMTWAIEVCLDHGQGRLQRSPQLPGEDQVQLQLIPSCGMQVHADAVITTDDGLVFHCDGGGFGNGVYRVSNAGSPPHRQLTEVSYESSTDVEDSAVEVGAPPRAVPIGDLYAHGAGKVVVYPAQPCPPRAKVGGTVTTLQWQPTAGTKFTFRFCYASDKHLSAVLVNIEMDTLDFHGHDYFLPLYLNTRDRAQNPVKIEINCITEGGHYDKALRCSIDVPGYKFDGIAVEYPTVSGRVGPRTAWD
ncbi:MAG TPA: hypothetical protein ENJ79_10790 [Gammaproteobacteria bacterium]|nr:hypothetical protein [Gammaproteobacteria bacterium]